MGFPNTRLTLIQRLAAGGSAEDWQSFMQDYWGPVCRFSLRWGAEGLSDAEDIATQTFEILWENRLLVRWVSNRSAKLRSLLCSVARKVLANRHRAQAGRQRLAHELAEHLQQASPTDDEQADAFYAAWAEDLVAQAAESITTDYYRQAKGDYVRVLYGRLCQRLTIAAVAEALEISPAAVDNYFRHARQRLGDKLEELVRSQVEKYSPDEESAEEFAAEWRRLGTYLSAHGGLEEALQRACALLDPAAAQKNRRSDLAAAWNRLTSIRVPQDAPMPPETP
jgi:RNA polymerase sigma factor (sigma-70 family)